MVVNCAAYLQAMGSAATGRERVTVRADWPLIRAACDLADETSLRRAEVQARLLAGQSDAQIAEKCQVQPELVGCFEQLFFSVRRCLRAVDYLVMQTVGRAVHEGFNNDQAAEFLHWCALAGGVVALDFLVDRLHDVLDAGQQPTLLAYLDRRIPLAVQGFVAAHTVPISEQAAGVWVECHSRLLTAKGSDAYMEELDIERRVLIRLAKAHLSGKPLPINPVIAAPKSPKAAATAGDPKPTTCSAKPRKLPSLGDVKTLMAELGVGAK